ncbi:PriCT-2 domain-containing protein [Paraburkholderia adhaesiva]|uniref:PriCT-2 domain-containing protein n=1 Tax=Paraburkholderia adhaesiva TaxID=2883244 RepID=UPI001F43948D|nr:PriCT-2 domain-containing protein [Paraburkholderia adhaesiva]
MYNHVHNGWIVEDSPVRALMHCPVPEDRFSWVRLLMAFKRAGGDEAVAREWSSHGDGYDPSGFTSTWKSIGMTGKIDPRLLYATASRYGYRSRKVMKLDGQVPR